MVAATTSNGYLTNEYFLQVQKQLGEFVAIPSVSNPNSPHHNNPISLKLPHWLDIN